MGTIILIRHAASTLNEENRIHGRKNLDGPLSPTGKAQAEALAKRLREIPISRMFSSPAARALNTAKAAAEKMRASVTVVPVLYEKDHGSMEGKTWEEVWSSWPAVLNAWRKHEDIRMPDGENNKDVERRVMPFVRKLIKEHPDETVAVFTHAGVIRNIVSYYLRVPYGRRRLFWIRNTSITTLEFSKDRFAPRTHVMIGKLNDTSHL